MMRREILGPCAGKIVWVMGLLLLMQGGASAQQVTIEKVLPLKDMEPGSYTLRMKVMDRNSNQTLTPSATFTVT